MNRRDTIYRLHDEFVENIRKMKRLYDRIMELGGDLDEAEVDPLLDEMKMFRISY
jgi:hypothetical protein